MLSCKRINLEKQTVREIFDGAGDKKADRDIYGKCGHLRFFSL